MQTENHASPADTHGHAHIHGAPHVTLDIATPKGPFRAEFLISTSVATVIAVVVDEKKLDKKDAFDLVLNGKVLQPTERPLASFGLHNGDRVKMELVATGSGV